MKKIPAVALGAILAAALSTSAAPPQVRSAAVPVAVRVFDGSRFVGDLGLKDRPRPGEIRERP